jgi:hypothetical protein
VISQITKTGKTTQTLIANYPFHYLLSLSNPVPTFGKYYRLKNCVTASYDRRSARTPSLYVDALIANPLAIHLTSAESPRSAASAINHMERGNKKIKKTMALLQNASIAAELTRPILPNAHHTNNSTFYINDNRAFRSNHLHFNTSKLTF